MASTRNILLSTNHTDALRSGGIQLLSIEEGVFSVVFFLWTRDMLLCRGNVQCSVKLSTMNYWMT